MELVTQKRTGRRIHPPNGLPAVRRNSHEFRYILAPSNQPSHEPFNPSSFILRLTRYSDATARSSRFSTRSTS